MRAALRFPAISPLPPAALAATGGVCLLSVYWAGFVGAVWAALIVARLSLLGRSEEFFGLVFRQTLGAMVLGVTPQLIFLIGFNWGETATSSPDAAAGWLGSTEPAGGWSARISWYEHTVNAVNDAIGDYLLPSFIVGASISIGMFVLIAWLDRPGLREAWSRIQEAARFIGLTLVAATTLTLMIAVPAGAWEPNARGLLHARLSDHLKAEVGRELYREASADYASPNSKLAQAIANAITTLRPFVRDQVAVIDDLRDQFRQQTDNLPDPPPPAAPATPRFGDLSRAEARLEAYAEISAVTEAEQRRKAAKAQFIDLISSAAGSLVESFAGQLAGALVEDATGRVVDRLVARSRGVDDVAAYVAMFASGSATKFAGVLRSGLRGTTEILADTVRLRRAGMKAAEAREAAQTREIDREAGRPEHGAVR